jgi:hypothetical protein
VLDTADWRLRRVSDEPTHVLRLAWSPDGAWLLHEGTASAGRAAGYSVSVTTDASAADGSRQLHLWGGSGIPPGAPWPDAWLGDHEAVVHREGMGCVHCDLVRIDASTGVSQTILGRMESNSLAVDPSSGMAALDGTVYDGGTAREPAYRGVVLAALDGSSVRVVGDVACRVAAWGAEGLPFAWLSSSTGTDAGCQATAFGLDGSTRPLDVPPDQASAGASVSPGGAWRVLYGEAGWQLFDRSSSEPIRPGFEGPVSALAWRPDDGALVWLSGEQLWVAEVPDGTPRQVDVQPAAEGWSPRLDITWLEP